MLTKDLKDVELLRVGSWHGKGCPPKGCEFTESDLDKIVSSYEATKDVMHPPLKLGHNAEQRLLKADGLPAAGWVENIRRVGSKLIGDFLKVPQVIADLIDVGAYRTRSVELHAMEIGGTLHELALTAVALLGEEIPAVEGLADITKLYQSMNLELDVENDAHVIIFQADVQPEAVGLRYVDQAERLLDEAEAFVTRTEKLVNLRKEAGRSLSADHLTRIAEIRDNLSNCAERLTAVGEKKANGNVKSKMRAQLMLAETSMSSIQED